MANQTYEDPIILDSTGQEIVDALERVAVAKEGIATQIAELPTASATYNNKIFQYVGATTQDYINGYFYKCVLDGSSYEWENINVSEGSGVIDGSTVTPTDDIATWLKCAGLTETYTTLNDVLSDDDVMEKLFRSENASNYLVRSTTWVNDICANQTAMILIGANDYCADKLLEDNSWSMAICASTYFEQVLNAKVPTLTSQSSQVTADTSDSGYEPYKAFDGNDSTGWYANYSNTKSHYIEYDFNTSVDIWKIYLLLNAPSAGTLSCDLVIKGSNDKSTWETIKTDTITIINGTPSTVNYVHDGTTYRYIKFEMNIYLSHNSKYVSPLTNTIQIYGRATKTTIYSAANDIVSFVDDEGAKVVTTDSTGKGEVTIVCKPNTDITFTSSVAKDPNNLNENYSKVVTVKTGEPVYVMPNKDVLYWWGYKGGNFAACTTANGWGRSGFSFVEPTYNTNSIDCFNNNDTTYKGIGNKNPISGTKLHRIGKGSGEKYNELRYTTNKGNMGDSSGIIIADDSILSTAMQYVVVSQSFSGGYIFNGSHMKNNGVSIYALWYDDGNDDGNYDKADADLIAPVQKTLTAKKAYAVGEQFVYNQTLYRVAQAIAQGAQITIGTNAVLAGCVTEQINNLNPNRVLFGTVQNINMIDTLYTVTNSNNIDWRKYNYMELIICNSASDNNLYTFGNYTVPLFDLIQKYNLVASGTAAAKADFYYQLVNDDKFGFYIRPYDASNNELKIHMMRIKDTTAQFTVYIYLRR